MESPIVVTITQLRRDASSLVRQAEKSNRPLFVTQCSYVTAVLLSRLAYDRLLRAADSGEGRHDDPPITSQDAPDDPLAVFGPLPEGTLFETQWGLVHRETAAFFMQEGDAVRPFIRRLEDDE